MDEIKDVQAAIRQAALASALLLAAARWANEEAPSHDLAEARAATSV